MATGDVSVVSISISSWSTRLHDDLCVASAWYCAVSAANFDRHVLLLLWAAIGSQAEVVGEVPPSFPPEIQNLM